MLEWINEQLSAVLDFPAPSDLTEYILSIENARDLEDYLKTLLNFDNPQHYRFYLDLVQQRQKELTSGGHGYRKSDVHEHLISPKVNEKKKKNKDTKNQLEDSPPVNNQRESLGKKKSKYVNLYSQEGQSKDVILLKGRHHCECQASKHKLISNCLQCGRIVCEQEGSGPCFFCDNLVCSAEEQQLLTTGTKQANHLYQKLLDRKKPEGLEAAVTQRDRLLEYDKTSERRTKVIDDESDYYATNSVWLSEAEREKLEQKEEAIRAKRHASRFEKKFTLDFAGRKVVEDEEDDYGVGMYDGEDMILQEITHSLNNSCSPLTNNSNVHPGIEYPQPIFQDTGAKTQNPSRKISKVNNKGLHRIQDREFLEMSDEGCCLSMHQPWASLLVSGIKIHEGRTWYTPHRGRLWIAATTKLGAPEEIQIIERTYKVLNKVGSLQFPEHYPTSCLLGCVNVVDCLQQEEYRSKFPDGESDSPFVFICESPQELPILFPMQGNQKIYKLDPKVHQAAQKSLQRIAKLRAEQASSS